jgi:hypothetical protein
MAILSNSNKKFLRNGFVTFLAFLILSIDWVYKIFILPRQYWNFRYDPETIYFYGGLAFLEGRLPENIDNPGMPVHLLSAALIYLGGYGPLEFDSFRFLGYIVTFFLYMVVGFILLQTVLSNLPVLIQSAGLLTYFLCPQSLEYNNIWSPEMFYFPFGSLLLIAMWGGDWASIQKGRTFMIGFMVGICCSLKFTFLAFIPALLVSLMLVPDSNQLKKLQLTGIAILSIIFGFVSMTIFVAPLYYKMFSRLWLFASHKGEYGSGDFGLPEIHTILINFQVALSSAKGWHVLLIAIFILMGIGMYEFNKSQNHLRGRIIFFSIFSTIALTTTYALAVRIPNMPTRYLLTTGVIGLLVFAISMKIMPRRWISKLQIPIILIISILIYKHIIVDINSHKQRVYEGYKLRKEIEKAIEKVADSNRQVTVLYSWRVPKPSFALRFLANENQLRVIETEFPHEGHYDVFKKKIYLPYKSLCWDYLVIREPYINEFPEQLGPSIALIGEYRIFKNIKIMPSNLFCK